MANIFVRGTTGVNTNTGADWNNAKQSVAGALAIAVSNDVILVDNDAGELFTANAAITWTPPAGNVAIISVTRSGTTGFSRANGAREVVGGVTGAFTIANAAGSSMYVYGMTVFAGSTNTASNIISLLNITSVSSALYLDNCILQLPTISAGAIVQCGVSATGNSRSSFITIRNSNFVYGSRAGSAISLGEVVLECIGLGFGFGATKPAQIFTVTNVSDTPIVTVRDCDWSGTAVGPVILLTNFVTGSLLFKNCKFVGNTWALGAWSYGSASLTFRNCSSTTYSAFLECFSSTGQQSVSLYEYITNSDAAVNAGSPASWTANSLTFASEFSPYITLPLEVWNDVIGTRTATIEFCSTAGGAIPLTDRQIWTEGTYDSSASNITNRNLDSFTGTGVAHPTSTAPWAVTTVTQQQLQVTFTASVVGNLQLRIYVGIASTLLFVNPRIKLS